jgi:ATP-dependent Lon protease
VQTEPFFVADVTFIQENNKHFVNNETFVHLIEDVKEVAIEVIRLSQNIPPEIATTIKNITNHTFLVNFLSSNTNIDYNIKQELLNDNDIFQRALHLQQVLTTQIQDIEVQNDIHQKTRKELDKQSRDYYLNQQMKTIQDELGQGVSNEAEKLLERAKNKKWNDNVKTTFENELNKLKTLHANSPDYSTQLNYLNIFLDIPWNEFSQDNLDIKHAEDVLNEDHFGLEKVKERILEYLSVLRLKGNLKSPILCLVGPPGVGKTSLGKSVARALGRKYVRMSLGGLHDEAEIRGHRKTYIGAMPGRIIQNIKKAGTSNPVFILDEIDKIGNDFRGDPASALLEVLDPEQNTEFHDNYLDIDYDLSNVLFIATANVLNTINPALIDRMEIINVSGYILEEKIEIAKRHLINKEMENNGLIEYNISFDDKTIEKIIDNYTRESGVRNLNKKIATIARKIAKKVASDEKFQTVIYPDDIKELLGVEDFVKESYDDFEMPGVVTGLAWTAVGGEILFVETSIAKGKGTLTLTGNLGDVMKESATIALEYIKANYQLLGIDFDIFENNNIHLHVPEGAIPKDGPSAGITMATAMASALTKRKVRSKIAMTGEITLRGKVLPVGGIKEKILAAKRAGIDTIILSKENRKNIEDINDIYLKGLIFKYVDVVKEVWELALLA